MNLLYSSARFIFFTLLVLSLSVAADTGQPEHQDTGLEIIKQSRYGEILVAPDVDWSGYTKVRIDKATVAFRKNWVRDQRVRNNITIREKDEQRIKSDLSLLLPRIASPSS